jgi:nucleoside-diphosphate-sugar epimerase
MPDADASAMCDERTLFECAVTAAARRLWASGGIPTQGFRIGAVYGAGHNEGWTASFTEVIAAAVRDAPLVVAESTPIRVSYAADIARALVDGVHRASTGARVTDLPGHDLPMTEFVSVVRELTGNDTVSVGPLPTPRVAPDGTRGGPLLEPPPTPIRDGVRSTLEVLRWAPESLFPALVNDPGPGI